MNDFFGKITKILLRLTIQASIFGGIAKHRLS